MRGEDTKRGCTILIIGLPICGLVSTGVGGLLLVLLLFLLMLIGCSAPPATVGVILYPSDQSSVPSGEVIVEIQAYRRGWATLQFDSGWSSSKSKPERIVLKVDDTPVFTWQKGDNADWYDRLSVPILLDEGDHTLALEVVADGRVARDTVQVTAVEKGASPWHTIPLPNELSEEMRFIVDAEGRLWRIEAPQSTRTRVLAADVVEGKQSSPVDGTGVITAIEGATAHFFLLETGTLYRLVLETPLPDEAVVGTLYLRETDESELFWKPYTHADRWNGHAWQSTDVALPPFPRFARGVGPTVWEMNTPQDVWVLSERSGYAAQWDGANWRIVAPPAPTAKGIRARIALHEGRFWVWDGSGWRAAAPLPDAASPHAFDFIFADQVLLCGDALFFASPAYEWEPEPDAFLDTLRVFQWDGGAWTWHDVQIARFPHGRLACVGGTPWLLSSPRAPRDAIQSNPPQVRTRFGGRFLGPESNLRLEKGRVWMWDGAAWREAVQPPFFPFFDERLPGNGLGFIIQTSPRLTFAAP